MPYGGKLSQSRTARMGPQGRCSGDSRVRERVWQRGGGAGGVRPEDEGEEEEEEEERDECPKRLGDGMQPTRPCLPKAITQARADDVYDATAHRPRQKALPQAAP